MAVHPADGRSLKFHIIYSFLGRKSPITGPKQFSEADENLLLEDGVITG
ncbi:hypothetical protein Ahu01nite_060240 [Winogradskya humida]|uniref:Uncharacterized protein n=1 Tax=Winogradskya humida TaxID=113566 RepID=A0ABQ3ZWC8_9ACTN|nr:hypothetical protein Ahu01nite_060240 [Actinoplanes humidus]